MVDRICFFLQAEDGIRDLVRSRGLGDVDKRQGVARWLRRFVAKRCDRCEVDRRVERSDPSSDEAAPDEITKGALELGSGRNPTLAPSLGRADDCAQQGQGELSLIHI